MTDSVLVSISKHTLVTSQCHASVRRLAGTSLYENRLYCWERWRLRCDSVSHVSGWSAAVPLFLFAGRLGIAQGKAGRQMQGGEAAKNLTYYREVRLRLFAVTFRLSGLANVFLFFPPSCVFRWKIQFFQSPCSYIPQIWILSLFFLHFSLCCLCLCPSLSLTSCAVPSPEAVKFDVTKECITRGCVVCSGCVRILKRLGELFFNNVLAQQLLLKPNPPS